MERNPSKVHLTPTVRCRRCVAILLAATGEDTVPGGAAFEDRVVLIMLFFGIGIGSLLLLWYLLRRIYPSVRRARAEPSAVHSGPLERPTSLSQPQADDPFVGTPLEAVQAGTKLAPEQSAYLKEFISELVHQIRKRRKHVRLPRESLKNTMGGFLKYIGFDVHYAVRLEPTDFPDYRAVFDIMATGGKLTLAVRVKEKVTTTNLGKFISSFDAIQHSQSKVYLIVGTDMLNYTDLIDGPVATMVREFLERRPFGVLVADTSFMASFGNYDQLLLNEMPRMIVSEEKVGEQRAELPDTESQAELRPERSGH